MLDHGTDLPLVNNKITPKCAVLLMIVMLMKWTIVIIVIMDDSDDNDDVDKKLYMLSTIGKQHRSHYYQNYNNLTHFRAMVALK